MAENADRSLWQRARSFFSGLTGFVAATAALIVAVVGALTALGLIGGSGDSRGTGTPPPVAVTTDTRAWAARANEICGRSNDTVAALPQPAKGIPTAEATGLVKTTVTIGHQTLRGLTALTPPPGKERQVASFLRLDAAVNSDLEQLADDLTLGDLAAVERRAAILGSANTAFNKAAIALGATTCAEGATLTDLPPGG